jgi:hypothetical protein
MSQGPDPPLHSVAVPADVSLAADKGPPGGRRSRALALMLGVVVGLAAAELGFRARDGGAFPLVNTFEPDEARGVRLRPGAETKIVRPGGPALVVRTNADGYRGQPWPAPSPTETLVVGDSQAFGLGVAEGEMLSARLSAALPDHPAVLDASVPTYGPPEYLLTMADVLRRRPSGRVLVVVNLVNDLFELEESGARRYTAVDGWAVRREAAPADYAPSPLRTRAIASSHATFALWRWVRTRQASARARAPEPSWPELVALSHGLDEADEAARVGAESARGAELRDAERAVDDARAGLTSIVAGHRRFASHDSLLSREWRAYAEAGGEPENQTFELDYGGCIPPPLDWPSKLVIRRPAERIRKDVEDRLRVLGDTSYLSPEIRAEIHEAFARRESAKTRLAEVQARPAPPTSKTPTPLAGFLGRASSLARDKGAAIALVLLPLSVETSPRARATHGVDDAAKAALASLRARLLEDAKGAGITAIDPFEALAAEGDEAYLPDGHLSAAGQTVVARAVAARFAQPP